MVRIILCVTLIKEDIFRVSLYREIDGKRTFYLAREVGKFGHVLAEKKVTVKWLMNSNTVKPEKFGHPHLVYHFTIPLSIRTVLKFSFTVIELLGSVSIIFTEFDLRPTRFMASLQDIKDSFY